MKRSELKQIIKEVVEEARTSKGDYKVNHPSYTSAIQEVERFAEANGYTLDEDQLATDIGMGPAKPKEGITNKFHLDIFKDGKPQRKKLQVQIYGKGNKVTEPYELNMYIL
jgi:hypothetical protein